MNRTVTGGAIIVALVLSGCSKSAEPAATVDNGWSGPFGKPARYGGIGLYPAGDRWSKMIAVDKAAAPVAARIADDEQVVVVVDSRTGEVRQCGNLSGYCIAMNPWARPLPPTHLAPVSLSQHAPEAQPGEAAEIKGTVNIGKTPPAAPAAKSAPPS